LARQPFKKNLLKPPLQLLRSLIQLERLNGAIGCDFLNVLANPRCSVSAGWSVTDEE
jgi:hypothetical protein